MPSVSYFSGGSKFQNNISASSTSTVYTVPAGTFASLTIAANINIVSSAQAGNPGDKFYSPATSGSATVYVNGQPIYSVGTSGGGVISSAVVIVTNMQVGPGTVVSVGVGGNAGTRSCTGYVFGLTFTN